MQQALPLDRLLTEFAGDNIGVDVGLLVHSLLQGAAPDEKDAAFKRIMEHVLPHGMWTRPVTREQLRMMNEALPVEDRMPAETGR